MNSDFTYQLRRVKGHYFIMIEDLDIGGMSVTNNIRNVVELIAQREFTSPGEYLQYYKVIYKDSQGRWDGYDYNSGFFYPILADHWLKAAIQAIKNYSNK